MDKPQEFSKNLAHKGLPLHPQTVKQNKTYLDSRVLVGSDNNTILDTISSSEDKQYFYHSPQPNVQFNNKLKDLNRPNNQNEEYYSLEKKQIRQNQITPNSLDYSASTEFNARNSGMGLFQNKNLKMSKNLGNIQAQYEQLQRANQMHVDDQDYATLGPGSANFGESQSLQQDEELESTVFGQSSINQATFHEGTTRLSDEQAYFGNLKGHPPVTGSFSGTGNKINFSSNLQSISSSAESTPHKAFKAALMSRQRDMVHGQNYLSSKPQPSDTSIGRSYDSGFGDPNFQVRRSNQGFDYPETRVNDEMHENKGAFNPMTTHDQYDLKKYTNPREGDEIYIDNNVQPISEHSDEESKYDKTRNTTPMSSEPRGAYPVSSSNTTPQNYRGTYKEEKEVKILGPKFKGDRSAGDKSTTDFNKSSSGNYNFEDKTTDLTGYKSFIDKHSSNLTQSVRDNSTPNAYDKSDESLLGSHIYQKYNANNLQFSQLSQGSVGPYDGATNSKIMSSPAIYERGPESEEESQNDSQLKMSQLNDSPDKQATNQKLNFEDLEQPKTGTIGENTNRLATSSSINYVSSLDHGSYQNYPPGNERRKITDFEENDYKSQFKEYAQRLYERQAANDYIKPSTLFKERFNRRFQNRYSYLTKRTEEAYEELKKTKLLSIYGPQKEKEIDQMMDNVKAQENLQPN